MSQKCPNCGQMSNIPIVKQIGFCENCVTRRGRKPKTGATTQKVGA